MGESLRPHPHWIRVENGKEIVSGGWRDSQCDYCDYAADMVYKGGHACFEHRNTLLRDKEKSVGDSKVAPKETPKH